MVVIKIFVYQSPMCIEADVGCLSEKHILSRDFIWNAGYEIQHALQSIKERV